VVVDLTATDFLDSTGLGALVAGFKRLRAHDGDMRLVCSTARIRKVFELTRLDLVLPIFESVEDACRAER
jgi:anti-sigma B factor antagonist